jgi:hypothetical protein
MRTIIVSSNCQTGGISAALSEIFSKDRVIPVPYPNLPDDQLIEQLTYADIWVSSGRFDLVEKILASNPNLVIYKIPELYFAAFFPDLIYTQKISTGEFVIPHYNSAICVWAYKNGLSVSETALVFTKKAFNELGYFSMWTLSVNRLLLAFEDCNLDIKLFLPFITRQGSFMYSVNHSKAIALTRLAKTVAIKMGAHKSVLEKDIHISDGLTDIVWPVYPEIADYYALTSGSYDWKFDGQMICGLSNYIDYSFSNYKKKNIERHDISFSERDESLYDRVLGSMSGVKNG